MIVSDVRGTLVECVCICWYKNTDNWSGWVSRHQYRIEAAKTLLSASQTSDKQVYCVCCYGFWLLLLDFYIFRYISCLFYKNTQKTVMKTQDWHFNFKCNKIFKKGFINSEVEFACLTMSTHAHTGMQKENVKLCVNSIQFEPQINSSHWLTWVPVHVYACSFVCMRVFTTDNP